MFNRFAFMQPYFFPYIGYFSLIDSADKFMFFDNVQYVRKSWMGRNRFLNVETGEPFYFHPGIIKPPYQAPLTSVEMEESDDWKNKIFEQTGTFKNNAPYYSETIDLLDKVFNNKYEYLVDFNMSSLKIICQELGIETEFDKYSNHGFWFDKKPEKGTWGLKVVKEMDTKKYVNSPGGESFIDSEGFTKADIKLGFLQPNIEPYYQGGNGFVSHLSILDVLFFNGYENTKEMVQNYEIKWVN
jgi:hypothetical protein